MNSMRFGKYSSDVLLLLTAIIWGLAFVAQRAGMEHIGPFAFNGIRFALGSISLLPLIYFQKKRDNTSQTIKSRRLLYFGGLFAGLVLFAGASFQQIGIVYTSAGNAGFITSLYVLIVPVLGLFWNHKVSAQLWIGAILAVVGLFYLSVNERFIISLGDGLVFISAFFWAGHVLIIAKYSRATNSLFLALIQFGVCSILSLTTSLIIETTTIDDITSAAIPILYGGVMSVGVAYTLQIFAQKKAHPSNAAIILSLESLFAAIGGWIILNEQLTNRLLIGGGLMLAGVIISQYKKTGIYHS